MEGGDEYGHDVCRRRKSRSQFYAAEHRKSSKKNKNTKLSNNGPYFLCVDQYRDEITLYSPWKVN